MKGFKQILLKDLVEQRGEDEAKRILSNFDCSFLNEDVDYFLKNRAIEFAKQGIAQTHLIFASHKNKIRLIAYYTLTNKNSSVPRRNIPATLFKKISKHGTLMDEGKRCSISAPLIAQLGKNYSDGADKVITGDELLMIACDKVKFIQRAIGGKIVYLECENTPRLVSFYENNGFHEFDVRHLDSKDTTESKGAYLLQMFKVLS